MSIAGWIVLALLLPTLVPILWMMIRPRRLEAVSGDGPREWPEVTVIVPSRNEGDKVQGAFASLLKLTYPRLRIIAIDDRSTDDTGAILDELAAGDSRVTVIHVDDLPDGWLGKNHANRVGVAETESPWLLFTDGDIHFAPDTLERAIQHATRDRVDHLTLFPGMQRGTFWEEVMVCTFGMLFSIRFPPWLVRTRLKPFYVGIGAFNLVRREAYESCGGHERLRLEVGDDVKLGKLIKAHGFKQDVLDGSLALDARWQVGLRGVIHGLTKNSFAVQGFSVVRLVIDSLSFVLIFLAPYVAAVVLPVEPALGFIAAVSLLQITFLAVVIRAGRNPLLSLLLPVTVSILLYITWRSAWVTLRRGGVMWRDTFYELKELKKGVV